MTKPNLTQGSNILLNLTMEKIKCFDPSNVGSWFDRIVHGLRAASVTDDQLFKIIYQALPETGQRQAHFDETETKTLTVLKNKLKNIYDPNPSTKAKAYISNYSLGGKSATEYVDELEEALGKNSTILAICFLNVIPDTLKETVKNKLLAQEEIKTIAKYVDDYINTYMKEEQSLFEIRSCKDEKNNSYVIPQKALVKHETPLNLPVHFIKQELENQQKINNNLTYEIKKLKEELPQIISSIRNINFNDNANGPYYHRARSQSRSRFNNGRQREYSRTRYNNDNICYCHKKFGDNCYKEKCPSWCQYNKNDSVDNDKICFGHKKFGDKCFPEKCPIWCKNNSSKNSHKVSAISQ